jgi:hypothetical protein
MPYETVFARLMSAARSFPNMQWEMFEDGDGWYIRMEAPISDLDKNALDQARALF